MSSRNVELEYKLADRQRKLEKLQERLLFIEQKIAEGVDFEEEKKLEARKDGIFEKIGILEVEIKAIKSELKTSSLEMQDHELLTILQPDSMQQEIQRAYQATVSLWPTPAPLTTTSPAEMLRELTRLGQSDEGYSAIESFIAHLWEAASQELLRQLKPWGESYFSGRNWSVLYDQIQSKLMEKVENLKPAILVNIRLAEELTTQLGNQPNYCLEAWLINDIEIYQEKSGARLTGGCSRLIMPGTPEAEPFVIDEINSKIQPLLNQWIDQAQRSCKKDPEFYVFVSKDLIQIAVDTWLLDAKKCLGHHYPVVVCCSDRRGGSYPIGDWYRFWEKHGTCAARPAQEAFIEGSDQELDNLIDALEAAKDDDTIMGLKLNTAPSPENLAVIFDELLMAGLPLALWSRCDYVGIQNAQELAKILEDSSLGNLSIAIKKKRYEARRPKNTPECHIGHHLSLLKDNPELPLPTEFIPLRSA